MKSGRNPRSYDTLKAFALALDTPLTTVSGWLRHPLWRWATKAPFPAEIVPDVLRWAADELEKGRPRADSKPVVPGSTRDLRDEKLRQEIRKLRAHADQAETALAKERGKLHDADQCEEEAVRRASLYRNAMQNVGTQVVSLALSAGMPHKSAPGFQKQVEELINGCLRHTAASADARSETGDG